ncbi:MAG: DUF3108 domain-containing protein [Myxococcaceae bacterium]|nr:DUF3108 domain-containing protein [Myxococcaceae bacterium]
MTTIRTLVVLMSLGGTMALAQDGGVKAISPFPTDSQCLPLGSIKQPIAFGPGETLEYDLDALGAKAGTMTMRVLPVREGLMPIEVHAKTNTFFSKVRRVDGTGTSFLQPRTLRPARYYEDAQENEWHRVADVTFRKNKTAKLVSSINGQQSTTELSYGNDVTDVAGAIFLMRQLELKEGKRLCFDVYGIRRIWRVWGTVQPKEHVSLPVGEFETWHLAGEAARHDWQDARRDIHVWITADERRIPIAALGSIDLGAVRATLTSFSRPGDKGAKAENKANLKW